MCCAILTDTVWTYFVICVILARIERNLYCVCGFRKEIVWIYIVVCVILTEIIWIENVFASFWQNSDEFTWFLNCYNRKRIKLYRLLNHSDRNRINWNSLLRHSDRHRVNIHCCFGAILNKIVWIYINLFGAILIKIIQTDIVWIYFVFCVIWKIVWFVIMCFCVILAEIVWLFVVASFSQKSYEF